MRSFVVVVFLISTSAHLVAGACTPCWTAGGQELWSKINEEDPPCPEICLEAGEFDASGIVAMSYSVTISGSKTGTTIINYGGAGALQIPGNVEFVMKDVTIYNVGVGSIAITSNYEAYVRLVRVIVNGGAGAMGTLFSVALDGSLEIDGCTLSGLVAGDLITVDDGGELVVRDSTFAGNTVAGLFMAAPDSPNAAVTVEGTTFDTNYISDNSILDTQGPTTVTNTTVKQNACGTAAGLFAIGRQGGSPLNALFDGVTVEGNGACGGMLVFGSGVEATVSGCSFATSLASTYAGFVRATASASVLVKDSTFDGDGVGLASGVNVVRDCAFVAADAGVHVEGKAVEASVTRSTFAGCNYGVKAEGESVTTVSNSLIGGCGLGVNCADSTVHIENSILCENAGDVSGAACNVTAEDNGGDSAGWLAYSETYATCNSMCVDRGDSFCLAPDYVDEVYADTSACTLCVEESETKKKTKKNDSAPDPTVKYAIIAGGSALGCILCSLFAGFIIYSVVSRGKGGSHASRSVDGKDDVELCSDDVARNRATTRVRLDTYMTYDSEDELLDTQRSAQNDIAVYGQAPAVRPKPAQSFTTSIADSEITTLDNDVPKEVNANRKTVKLAALDETNTTIIPRRGTGPSHVAATTYAPNASGRTGNESKAETEITIAIDGSMTVMDMSDPSVELVGMLGGGAFGDVYHYVWNFIDVAVKVVRGVDESGVQAFVEEAQMLAQLRCPFCVSYAGLCLEPLAIVTEYMPGGDVKEFLEQPADVATPERRRNIVTHVAKGLAFLHNSGVVHRDLKPANILLTQHYDAKLADFGLSGDKEIELSGAGTLLYCAPEVVVGAVADMASDVYSFACVVIEILTGQRAFGKDAINRRKQPYMSPVDVNSLSGVEPEVKVLLSSMLANDASQRPTMAEVIGVLRDVWG